MMTDPIVFDSTTARLRLPLLFTGQAQKEVFVNEAHVILDALVHGAIEAESDVSPADPQDGDCWLVAPTATGEWSGHEAQLACRQAGQWIYISPQDGMRVFDRSRGQELFYSQGWIIIAPIQEPIGGSNVDPHARAAIADLISALTDLGLLPPA
jgi:hypothetical protein